MGYKATFDRRRAFGIELEFYGVNSFELQYTLAEWGIPAKIELYENPHVPHWTIGSDDSIQGEDAIELRSPVLTGIEGLSQVKRVLTLLDYVEAKVNDTCGVHAHLFIEDFTGANTLALLRLYAKFESVIDGLVDVSRRGDNNIHCRSLMRDDNLAWISSLDKSGNARAVEVVMNYNNLFRSRKDKVSLCSYLKYGTVEFRHLGATLDINDIQNWLIFTNLLVGRVKQASISREMSSNPTLSEFLRVLGVTNFQGCIDPLAVECREWIYSTYSNVRKRKKSTDSKVLA